MNEEDAGLALAEIVRKQGAAATVDMLARLAAVTDFLLAERSRVSRGTCQEAIAICNAALAKANVW